MSDKVTVAAKVDVQKYNLFIDKLNDTPFTITDMINYMMEDFAAGTYDPVKNEKKTSKILKEAGFLA